ncbi:hypothetical protein AMATHDRAFT_76385 [Amanita thiersii Skay4041]|uniref:Calcineurin-like phosphoesterase domain-containing protein n=1 Tax=Amanita thiersii Skay4041 TaxID=703135 RepID=A0A2A9NN51_9AGAR|nr:hypothetical protein AMATHDRAFT_76385 [Amanita thiersii Skay4041]
MGDDEGLAPRVLSTQTVSVYLNFKPDAVPRHPGLGWTRFVCISDTHSTTPRVPMGDVLLHAGDLSSWGKPSQMQKTLKWLRSLPHPVKVVCDEGRFVAGNHDVGFLFHGEEKEGMFYLQYQPLIIPTLNGGKLWRIFGSPAVPMHGAAAFNYKTPEEAAAVYSMIPPDVEILITHTPPHMIFDLTKHGRIAGCPTLLYKLNELTQCRLHVFGHIHESYGAMITEYGRVMVNAAITKGYPPIVVDLKDETGWQV